VPRSRGKLPLFASGGGRVKLPPVRRGVAGLLLLTSLLCNLRALTLPFMELRTGLKHKPYSLLTSAHLLWTSHLQVLAVLVVAFSVIFPFVKLGVLSWFCSVGRLAEPGRRVLALVELLGKWSMLDVFLVCIILTLTSGQLLVGAKPLEGITVFVGAIILSMIAGEVISSGLPHAAPKPSSPKKFRHTAWLLPLAGIALAGALRYPFLRIHDWFVADKSYSIMEVIPALRQAGATVPGQIVGLFLIGIPLATWVVTCAWWWRVRKGDRDRTIYQLMLLGRRWSMLDVFGLALAIFAFEGEYLMKTEVRLGAIFLAAVVGVQLVVQAALARAFARD
jgi:paraquat-inducible protein A